MKNYRCSKLIVLLLAILMAAITVSAMAEEKSSAPTSTFVVLASTNLEDGFMKTAPVIVDAKNKTVADFSAADPNGTYTLKLNVANPANAGDDDAKKLPSDTSKVVVFYTVENMKAAAGTNGEVSWTFNEKTNQIIFVWPEGEKTSFTAEIPVIPNYSTENDLSGSYVLGTAGNIPEKYTYRVMMTPNPFMDGSRARLKGVAFEEVDGKVYILSEAAASVWELKHVSGNYYTVRSMDNGKYLKIETATNGLLLEEATDFTAQKLLVEKVKEGYYAFKYKGKSINNSSYSATKGFASYDSSDKGGNAILKLYNPADVITEPIKDLSGTWLITNAVRKNILTAEKNASNVRLGAISYITEDDFLNIIDDKTTFTFENIIRDWYTVKTENGYLNIDKNGAFISDNPQHLVVKTDKQYNSIILSDGELYDVAYTLNNVNGKASDGYGSVVKHTYNDNTRLKLVSVSKILEAKAEAEAEAEAEAVLKFDVNGGTVSSVPSAIMGAAGQKVTLPDMDGTKDGQPFIGWIEVSNIFQANSGVKHNYHEVYKPGTTYTLKTGMNTLYALYNVPVKQVQFGIRADGVIQDEPNNYDAGAYKGHFIVDGSILKETRWVIDIDSTKRVDGYYINNDVIANLNWIPTSDQIADALKKEGNIDFDPNTQYIHYYVIKPQKQEMVKIDGVIRNKASVEVSYNVNAPEGVDKTQIANMPGGYQVVSGTEILIGTGKNSTEIKTPSVNGYVFGGWNTESDGSGTAYSAGHYVRLQDNLNLYAQWIPANNGEMVIIIHSDWPDGKLGYVGAEITLRAELTGFEGKQYTLQWQYAVGDAGEWIDIPNTDSLTYTFKLNEVNTHYSWRCVARNVR